MWAVPGLKVGERNSTTVVGPGVKVGNKGYLGVDAGVDRGLARGYIGGLDRGLHRA